MGVSFDEPPDTLYVFLRVAEAKMTFESVVTILAIITGIMTFYLLFVKKRP